VLRETEDGRAAGGGVGPQALEDARPVVQGVREHGDLRLGLRHKGAVHPDLAALNADVSPGRAGGGG
jgi:hypothetical protein